MHDDGYRGPAALRREQQTVDVVVDLRGVFQPIDGRYHWYGRVDADQAVDRLVASGDRVMLRTPHGEAEGRLSDIDPWSRYRITGVGRPPFLVDVSEISSERWDVI